MPWCRERVEKQEQEQELNLYTHGTLVPRRIWPALGFRAQVRVLHAQSAVPRMLNSRAR